MSQTGKRYSAAFKNSIVKLYHEEHRSKLSLSNEYNVSAPTIARWIKMAEKVDLPNGKSVTTKEFQALSKENARLKEELEILKAAAVLLAKK